MQEERREKTGTKRKEWREGGREREGRGGGGPGRRKEDQGIKFCMMCME